MASEEPEREVMIKPSPPEGAEADSTTAADAGVTGNGLQHAKAKEVDVDEYLLYVGQFGKFQILLVLLFCLIIIPSTYQTLIMSFVGSNPSWRCSGQHMGSNATTGNTTTLWNATSECTIKGEITNSHASYEDRCSMKRSSWEFTKRKEYSIVTDVRAACL